MKLLKVTSPKGNVSYVNPEYIMSIEDSYNYKNEKTGESRIAVQGAMVSSYYDTRTPTEIADAIEKLYRTK